MKYYNFTEEAGWKRVDKGYSLKNICTYLDVRRSTIANWKKNHAQVELWFTKMVRNVGLVGRSTMNPAEKH